MDFNQLLDGLRGWPAAIVLVALIAGVAWVLGRALGSDMFGDNDDIAREVRELRVSLEGMGEVFARLGWPERAREADTAVDRRSGEREGGGSTA